MKLLLLFKISLQNLTVDYHHSKISYLWIPVSFMILVFAKGFFLSDILRIDSNFILYLCIGVWIWNYIALAVPSCGDVLFNNHLVLNINIHPKDILTILHLRLLMTFMMNLVVLFIFLLFFDVSFNPLAFISSCLTLILLVHQVGKLLSIISFYLRDLTQFINSMMIVLFFLSPIFWYPQQISSTKVFLLQFNPIFHILNIFRDAIILGSYNQLSFMVCVSLIVVFYFINYFFVNKKISYCANQI